MNEAEGTKGTDRGTAKTKKAAAARRTGMAAKRKAAGQRELDGRITARHMVEADGASRRAVPRQLQAAAFLTAWRTAEASAAGRMNASS